MGFGWVAKALLFLFPLVVPCSVSVSSSWDGMASRLLALLQHVPHFSGCLRVGLCAVSWLYDAITQTIVPAPLTQMIVA